MSAETTVATPPEICLNSDRNVYKEALENIQAAIRESEDEDMGSAESIMFQRMVTNERDEVENLANENKRRKVIEWVERSPDDCMDELAAFCEVVD